MSATNQYVNIPSSQSGLVMLSQTIVSNSSTNTINFSSIPQTYSQLQVTWFGQSASTNGFSDTLYLKLNNDSGMNYIFTILSGYGSTAGATQSTDEENIQVGSLNSTQSNTTYGNSGTIVIPGYTSTAFSKSLQGNNNSFDSDESQYFTNVLSAYWNSKAAVTSLQFSCTGPLVEGTVFTLYGIV